jgi:CRP/FNR family cyclic AMP-dependent transcriptional regulator
MKAGATVTGKRPTSMRIVHKVAPRHARIADLPVEHAPLPRQAGALALEDLRGLAAMGTIKTFRRHTVIVCEGDENDSFHLILTGRVKVFVSDEHGKEIVLATHGPGEYFGEMVVDEGPRCASVMTLEASRVAVITKAKFVDFLVEHPEVALKVLQKMVRRLRSLTQKVKSLALLDVHGRVTRLLFELSAHGSTRVIERLTQQEIANRVGASREMISRVMRDLAASGYISIDKKHITLLKRPRPH